MQFCLVYRVSGSTEPPPIGPAVFAIFSTVLTYFTDGYASLLEQNSARSSGRCRMNFVGLCTVLEVLLVRMLGRWLSYVEVTTASYNLRWFREKEIRGRQVISR